MATFILNDEKMFSDIADGIAIVINSETGIYYGMNAFGSAVFENILNGADSAAILAAIKEIPGAPDDMERLLTSFINALLEKEILLEGPAEGEAGSIDPEIAAADAFAPQVAEYTDAQDLLLADPIHEVKEDTGWKPEKDALETDAEVVKAKEDKMKE